MVSLAPNFYGLVQYEMLFPKQEEFDPEPFRALASELNLKFSDWPVTPKLMKQDSNKNVRGKVLNYESFLESLKRAGALPDYAKELEQLSVLPPLLR